MGSFADGTDAMIVTSNICLFSVRKIVTNSRDRHVVSRRRRSQRLYKSGSAAIQGGDESPHSKENTLCRTPQSVLLVHFLSSRFDRGGFSFSGTLPCVGTHGNIRIRRSQLGVRRFISALDRGEAAFILSARRRSVSVKLHHPALD